MKQITDQIDLLLSRQDRVIVAIDGFCTSGKTTLAARLAESYDCCVLHMDDFFLQPHQRTPERLAEPGGNLDYERFRAEVLQPLLAGEAFSYRPYDCSLRTLSDPVEVPSRKLTVIEGSYSHHPYFENPYDLKIFLTVTPDLQRRRILERPPELQQRFFDEWIPMEHAYFSAFDIPGKADLVLNPAIFITA